MTTQDDDNAKTTVMAVVPEKEGALKDDSGEEEVDMGWSEDDSPADDPVARWEAEESAAYEAESARATWRGNGLKVVSAVAGVAAVVAVSLYSAVLAAGLLLGVGGLLIVTAVMAFGGHRSRTEEWFTPVTEDDKDTGKVALKAGLVCLAAGVVLGFFVFVMKTPTP